MTPAASSPRWVGPDPERQVLLLAHGIDAAGRVLYTYSAAIGRAVTLTAVPGPGTLRPDDPALVSVVHGIQERMRGRDD